jgi:hypothetical protein
MDSPSPSKGTSSPPTPSPVTKLSQLRIPLWWTLPFILIAILILPSLIIIALTSHPPAQQPSTINNRIYTTPQPTANPTNDWQVHRFIDAQGFGYQLKLPNHWYSEPWTGGHSNPQPLELAQNFYGKNCSRPGRIISPNRISVLHYLSDNPQQKVAESITFQTGDPKVYEKSTIPSQGNTEITVLSNSEEFYAYAVSSKGYYQIHGSGECGNEVYGLYPQILSTFRFLDQNSSDNNYQSLCEQLGGQWLAQYQECENIKDRECTQILGGTYNSCASACRHQPDTQVCIQICVSVCQLLD